MTGLSGSKMPQINAYYQWFDTREPPRFRSFGSAETLAWQLLASMTIAFGLWYLHWRWSTSLNQDALRFSILVAMAETAAFIGNCLFFFDIWEEKDTPQKPPPAHPREVDAATDTPLGIDIFIATLDESRELVETTLDTAQKLKPPPNSRVKIWLLDDGNRADMRDLASDHCVNYLSRGSSRGFKAGNLTHALYHSRGDFVVICDADTQLFPRFLVQTLGYFRDPKVGWVQTPHWFFDIPDGESWHRWWHRRFGTRGHRFSQVSRWLSGHNAVGQDPFLSDPSVFFDVIQRRRNRNGASFCCGAASVHRREALMACALTETLDAREPLAETADKCLQYQELQPFKYHVSEDIFTSILLHSNGWTSVYHPQIEARMLSPWSPKAWATQRLKYAGGTFDIMLRANPLLRASMPFRTRLHYLATFWSYANVLWYPILLFAPCYSMISGQAPIASYTHVFFLHALPFLLFNELALIVGTKGHNGHPGRAFALGGLPLHWRALLQVCCGRRPKFPATPKTPEGKIDLSLAWPNVTLMGVLIFSALWGTIAFTFGTAEFSASMLIINLFWITCNLALVGRVTGAYCSAPILRLNERERTLPCILNP